MIEKYTEFLLKEVFQLNSNTIVYGMVSFFISDIIKIFLLMILVIFSISLIRSYFPPQKIKQLLSGKKGIIGYLSAGLLGIITPFCTCSAIPLFLGFLEAGVPLGVTFTFLVASPMINEIALILLAGTYGYKIALVYILSGLLIAILSGLVIGKLKTEHLINTEIVLKNIQPFDTKSSIKKRLIFAKFNTLSILKKVWPFIIFGVAIGALMHGFVPAELLSKYVGKENWFAVPIAVFLGVPLYSNAAGVIPIVSVLTEKGVAIGTSLAFMMAAIGLSLPEFLILKRIMKFKLILIFALVVSLGIIAVGYLFNFLLI